MICMSQLILTFHNSASARDTYTALGSEISKKCVVCGWSLMNRPFGRSVLVILIGSPSSSRKLFIIQYGRFTHPSSAMNSRTPACVEAAGFWGLESLNIHGDSMSNAERFAKAEGGMMTMWCPQRLAREMRMCNLLFPP